MFQVAVVDTKLLKLAVAVVNNEHQKVKKCFKKGEEFCSEEFKDILQELNDLTVKKVKQCSPDIQPPSKEIHPDYIDEVFKDFCKENHPDVGGDHDKFVELKDLYDRGEYTDFLEGCQNKDTPQALYEKWKHLSDEIEKTKQTKGYTIGKAKEQDRRKFHMLLAKEWESLENALKGLQSG